MQTYRVAIAGLGNVGRATANLLLSRREAGPSDFRTGGPGLGYIHSALSAGRDTIVVSKGARPQRKRTSRTCRKIGRPAEAQRRPPCRRSILDVAEQDLGSLDPLGTDLLVVLGGPIGVKDHAAYPVVTQEIGWLPLELTATGAPNPLAALQDVPVLHWHGDTLDLPDGCERLASTPICLNQAFSRGPNILGLQFHPELVAAQFEHWLLGHASELATSGVSPVMLRRDAELHGKNLKKQVPAC